MKHLRLLGLALLAVFALAAVVASTASAVEIGWLFLVGEKAPVKITGTGGEGSLIGKKTEGKVKCAAVKVTGTADGKRPGDTEIHIRLGIADIDFEGCKEEKGASKLACSSENAKGEKDPKEVILIPNTIGDFHIVAFLEGTKLIPGVYILLLETLKLSCGAGVAKVEVKGNAQAIVEGASETADVTKVTLNLKATLLKCDTADALCLELEKSPLLANFEAGFEPAEEITKVALESDKMIPWDF